MSQPQSTQVTHSQATATPPQPHQPRPTFSIACWLLAVIAFAQLITVGTALAVRDSQPTKLADNERGGPTVSTPQEPIQPRTLAQILADVDDAPIAKTPLRVPASPPRTAPRPAPQLPQARPANLDNLRPTIADARVERLVQEARALHLEDDMMRAMLKLDEAGRLDPTEPAVIYHRALLYEDMGIFPKAADQYQKIQQMGIKAGVYYRLAAAKLIKGMGKGAQKSDIAIGPMKTRKAIGPLAGRHVDIAVTLLARPDKVIDADDVEVQVHFYDRVNGGEIKKADTTAEITPTWADNKVDWQDAGNEETLRVAYTIPEADLADAHLLGRREYYGYVVELLYKGEVIDQQAQPSRLHSIHGGKMRPIPSDIPLDPMGDLPGDDGSLLPSIDNGYGDNPRLPPLPSR